MSLHRFGAMNSKSAAAGSKWVKSVMWLQRAGEG
jgi:hypothetical protein